MFVIFHTNILANFLSFELSLFKDEQAHFISKAFKGMSLLLFAGGRLLALNLAIVPLRMSYFSTESRFCAEVGCKGPRVLPF